ncbi:hypothetical protein [Agrobacterium genomosp. 13]|uniref:hypothetical protein n=1 Tax=Agrobacterium genomosp. 13 TaxID=1183419 RepID=UPI00111A6199|nr:hypothetical protein [Agrobacterium genomosp. 13]
MSLLVGVYTPHVAMRKLMPHRNIIDKAAVKASMTVILASLRRDSRHDPDAEAARSKNPSSQSALSPVHAQTKKYQ